MASAFAGQDSAAYSFLCSSTMDATQSPHFPAKIALHAAAIIV